MQKYLQLLTVVEIERGKVEANESGVGLWIRTVIKLFY